MKTTLPHVLLLALTLTLLGCLPSLNPLYTDKDLIHDPALLGAWVEENDDTNKKERSWTFTKEDEHAYKLEIKEGERQSPFGAHLLKLGGQRYLDICPADTGSEGARHEDLYNSLILPGHLFMKVKRIEPVLEMQALNGDWLEKFLQANPKALPHQKLKEGPLVLTGSTEELQAFVLQHADETEAWGDPSKLQQRAAAGKKE
jgi:hypothetical protein